MSVERREVRLSRGALVFAAVFVLVGVVLVWGGERMMGWHLRKGAVEPAAAMYRLGDWGGGYERLSDEVLSGPMVEELGTERYVLRVYGRRGEMGDEVVRVLVSYHTGWADSRPHVNELLYTVGGARGEDVGDAVLSDGVVDGVRIGYRVAEGGGDAGGAVVGLVYVANGEVVGGADEVEAVVSDLGVERAYWARVEAVALVRRGEEGYKPVTDLEVGRGVIRGFLGAGWGEVEK